MLCSAKLRLFLAVSTLVTATTRAETFPCSSRREDGDIRLVGGRSYLDGLVEVCSEERWRAVCDAPWSDRDAAVACRQLGFSDIGAIAGQYNYSNEDANQVHIRRTASVCTGSESSLVQCGVILNQFDSMGPCNSERASLTCQPLPGQEPPPCQSALFQCANNNCVYFSRRQSPPHPDVCNGVDDCFDCSDECHCTIDRNLVFGGGECRAASTTVCECSAEEFECANGFCVPLRAFCTGGDNCGDNSDDDPSTCQQIGIQGREQVEEEARRALRSTLLGVLVPLGVVVGAWLLLLASCLLLPACPLRRAWSSKTTPTREDHDTPLAAAPSE